MTRGGAPAADRAAGRCPLCGEANGCALASGLATPCWCTRVAFAADTLDRAAAVGGDARCICARCAAEAPR